MAIELSRIGLIKHFLLGGRGALIVALDITILLDLHFCGPYRLTLI